MAAKTFQPATHAAMRRGFPAPVEPSGGRGAQLVDAAVELLEVHGPEAMTTRKVTARIGASSQAIYTEFGSIDGLVAAVVNHGFELLRERLDALTLTGRTGVDLWAAAEVMRDFALSHRHLYGVMFAANRVGGHTRTGSELDQGVETLRFLHHLAQRAVDEGVFTNDDPGEATRQMWAAMHGYLMLELAGYMERRPDPVESFARMLTTTMLGLGATGHDIAHIPGRSPTTDRAHPST